MATNWASTLDDIGRIAAATSAGRAAGRTTQADFNLRSGIAQQDANVQASDATARRRSEAMAQALHGRLLQGTTDASVGPLPYGVNKPTITGGARPSNIVGAMDLGKTIAAQGDAGLNAPAVRPENFSDLAPSPNGFDTALNVVGTASPLLSSISKIAALNNGASAATSASGLPGEVSKTALDAYKAPGASSLGIGGKIKAGGLGGLLSGAQTVNDIAHGNVTSATINGAMTGFKYGGPIGAAVGAGVGAVGAAIRKNMNITKGGREEFAKKHGYPSLAAFNDYLRSLGPAGQQAALYGERVVGKHNDAQQNEWFALAQEAIDHEGRK